jgi:FAD/FMN-containing dehydrogenase
VSLERSLRQVVGDAHVLTAPDVTAGYGTDWTRRWSVTPRAVVRPGSTDEVAGVVRACADHGVGLVPQGGNTGLVGGSVPSREGLVVVSTTRLDRLGPVARQSRQVTAGAGVRVADLQRHAAAAGLAYGVDLASRDAATVGGTVATNAGGIRVVRHGDTRAQVLGVEAVLADGTVVSDLAGLPKDSAGYDLSGLLVGSEGTLGMVTAARLRLVEPLPVGRTTVLAGLRSVVDALGLLDQPGLLAAEVVVGPAMDLVCSALGLPFPLGARWPVYVLLETVGTPRLAADTDAAVDPRVWQYRERQTEAVATIGIVHKLDVAVPIDRLDELLAALPDAWAPYDGYVFGHLAEGNLHVEVAGAPPDDVEVDGRILRLVASMGGTVSAEHGVGTAKTEWLGLCRSPAQLAAMRRIKDALDPDHRMNPGVLLA